MAGAGLYLLFVALFSNSVADYDLWGYLSFGRIFWEDGYFPYRDSFSYTPTNPLWVYHEWLTGLVFYPIYKYYGPVGLQFVRYLIILLTIFLMHRTAVRRGASFAWSLAALIPSLLLISFGYVPVRAQVFTYLFFAFTLYNLEVVRRENQWSRLWWQIPLQILWCNLHGGFPAGPGLIFIYGLGEAIAGKKARPFFLTGAASLLVTLFNPYGIRYWQYMIQALLMPRPEIGEWASLYAAIRQDIYLFPSLVFVTLAVTGFLLYVFRARRDYTEWLVIAVTLCMGVAHIRHTVFFGLVFGAFIPLLLNEYGLVLIKNRMVALTRFPFSIAVVVFIAVFLVVNPLLSFRAVPTFSVITPSPHFPAGAYRWIRDHHFQGRILPAFEWGEFLIWYFAPSCRVAMDGRYETVYTKQVTKEYFDFLSGKEEGRIFIRKYSHELAVIRPGSGADFLLGTEPGWRKVYSDNSSVLYLNERRKPVPVGDSREDVVQHP